MILMADGGDAFWFVALVAILWKPAMAVAVCCLVTSLTLWRCRESFEALATPLLRLFGLVGGDKGGEKN